VKKVIIFLILIILMQSYVFTSFSTSYDNVLESIQLNKLQSWINYTMSKGKIPGASVVIVKGSNTIYDKGFGYADVTESIAVNSQTLFELGSTSKAFTALAVFNLENLGLLNLNDPISKYLPRFRMKYIGERRNKKVNNHVEITLEQLLHHTSGIVPNSIADIPVSKSLNSIEETVRTQVNKELAFMPGTKYQYATINYDILGLVIEKISGLSYEEYMQQKVFKPLGLSNTYLFQTNSSSMASGYKLGFLRPLRYYTPAFRGNTPAGYTITNGLDMAKWLKIQLSTQSLQGLFNKTIPESHIPNNTVMPNEDGSLYAGGWYIFQKKGLEISHPGNNPNYSSFVAFRPAEGLGVAVLTNINSPHTKILGQGIMDILTGQKPTYSVCDRFRDIDNISVAIICITFLASLFYLIFLTILFIQLIKQKHKLYGNYKTIISKVFFGAAFKLLIGFSIYNIPNIFFSGLPWYFIYIWGPMSFLPAMVSIIILAIIISLYYILSGIFPKRDEKSVLNEVGV
jgi:CubicO group peptidase (beta-lactamase class C family)